MSKSLNILFKLIMFFILVFSFFFLISSNSIDNSKKITFLIESSPQECKVYRDDFINGMTLLGTTPVEISDELDPEWQTYTTYKEYYFIKTINSLKGNLWIVKDGYAPLLSYNKIRIRNKYSNVSPTYFEKFKKLDIGNFDYKKSNKVLKLNITLYTWDKCLKIIEDGLNNKDIELKKMSMKFLTDIIQIKKISSSKDYLDVIVRSNVPRLMNDYINNLKDLNIDDIEVLLNVIPSLKWINNQQIIKNFKDNLISLYSKTSDRNTLSAIALLLADFGSDAKEAVPLLIDSFPIFKDMKKEDTTSNDINFFIKNLDYVIKYNIVLTNAAERINQYLKLKSILGDDILKINISALKKTKKKIYLDKISFNEIMSYQDQSKTVPLKALGSVFKKINLTSEDYIEDTYTYEIYLGAYALKKITGNNFGNDLGKWKQWWNENKL